jgi:hypothetical protein
MLAQAVKTAKAFPGAKIRVIGNHNPSETKGLAAERMNAVATRLVKEYGIDASSISGDVGTSGKRTVEVYVLP